MYLCWHLISKLRICSVQVYNNWITSIMAAISDFRCTKEYTQVKLLKKTAKRIEMDALCTEQKKHCLIIGSRITSKQQERITQQLRYAKWDRLKHDNLMNRIQKPCIKKLRINEEQQLLLLDIYQLTRNNITKNYSRLATIPEKVDIAGQLADLVEYIHGTGNCHGNLVSQNICLKGSRVKVLPPELSFYAKIGLEDKIPFYSAPEKEVCMATDIWNLGLIFYEIFRGEKLDETYELFPCMDEDFPYQSQLLQMKSKVAVMISGMLNKDPTKRITIKKVQSHLKSILNQSSSVLIPLLQQERDQMIEQEKALSRREDAQQFENKRAGSSIQRRIILTKHLLSLIYLPSNATITFRILFKRDAMEFMKMTYQYSQLPEELKTICKSSYDLFTFMTRLTKKQINFLSNGVLEITIQQSNER